VSHDPSEIILICRFAAQESFLIIINVGNSDTDSYFCGNCDQVMFLSKVCIKLIKRDSQLIYNVTKDFYFK